MTRKGYKHSEETKKIMKDKENASRILNKTTQKEIVYLKIDKEKSVKNIQDLREK